jgi:asparagine synthase (glutamine-hydrolysing)
MCGIAGIWRFNNKAEPKDKIRVEEALKMMRLRGPDNSAISHHNNYTLGHVRLSIIDTSDNANQPFKIDENELVFNGEIFNYKELSKEFEHNYKYLTNSDTEVLCKKLATQNITKVLNTLNGFFSFAFFNKENYTLTVARDRYGIKPLYYYLDEEKFCFASELKGLLKLGIKKEINKKALNIYLHLNYIPAPLTIFNEVYKLEPANYIEINTKGIGIKKYYNIEEKGNLSNLNNDYEKAKKEFRSLLNDSVAKRMISDVPLGCFLSGGIDSSVITGIAAGFNKNLSTFSIGFKDEPFFDETEFAELVAKKHKTNHTTFKISNHDLYQHLFEVLDCFDEPFADSSALNLYILSKETKKNVTVALSGDGADELLAGYNKHRAEWLYRKYKYAGPFLKTIIPLSSILPQSRNNSITNKIRQGNKFIEASTLNFKERYWRLAGFTGWN